MKGKAFLCPIALLCWCAAMRVMAGTLAGHLRDQNWYAQYPYGSGVYGVGYYEFATNANAQSISSVGGADVTDVFGAFQMDSLPAGTYTVASWDVWWRSAYAFDVSVPASGTTPDVDTRLKATMWGYPAFWDDTGWYEFGQTFVASGPISMLYIRCPGVTTYTFTLHENGPGGAQVGEARTASGGGDIRVVYGYNQMPTVAGRTYYLRARSPNPSTHGVIMQMDPRPDYSDPMPGGCLYTGDGTTTTACPDRDLGCVIMSDDDGLLTNMYTRDSGGHLESASVGQTFVARGVGLISAAAWLPDTSSTFIFRVLQGGPAGAQVGTTKRGKTANWASPELIVTWAPGECPLTAGQTYYLEITREGGGNFWIYTNGNNPYAYGQAYSSGSAVSGTDLAGTLMEEQSTGSATRPTVRITSGPSVAEDERGTDRLTIRWNTDVASDSRAEYEADNPPYTHSLPESSPVTAHALTITGLSPNTMYHFRVTSARTGYRSAISRDIVICTSAEPETNLLVNPGFEEGSGGSPRYPVPGWTCSGDWLKASDGSYGTYPLPPRTGDWFLQGSTAGGGSIGWVYQRVPSLIGKKYTFSAWVTTWPRENNTWKYDVWNNQSRLIYMRLGIDPTGGTDANSTNVEWTPRTYSHLRYTNLARSATARSSNITVFVKMQGDGVQWHLYGVDDCVLTCDDCIGDLRKIKSDIPNNTTVGFGNVVVSATPSGLGTYIYYVERFDRTSGIRLFSTSTAAEGDRAYVTGTLGTLSTGERYINNAAITAQGSATVPDPFTLRCSDVGGAGTGTYQSGVPGTRGPHNTGLLVRLAGRCTIRAADATYFCINDGSLPDPGVKVDTAKLNPAVVPAVGRYVVVTGVSSRWKDGAVTKPLLKTRKHEDMIGPLR